LIVAAERFVAGITTGSVILLGYGQDHPGWFLCIAVSPGEFVELVVIVIGPFINVKITVPAEGDILCFLLQTNPNDGYFVDILEISSQDRPSKRKRLNDNTVSSYRYLALAFKRFFSSLTPLNN
jgi:hypothetical protein